MGDLHGNIKRKIGSTAVKFNPSTTAGDVNIDTSFNPDLPEGAENVQDIVDCLGELAFLTELPEASTSEAGIVELVDNASSTSSTKAPTANALKGVNDSAIHKTGAEEITGVKTFTNGVIISGVTFSMSGNTLTLTPVSSGS